MTSSYCSVPPPSPCIRHVCEDGLRLTEWFWQICPCWRGRFWPGCLPSWCDFRLRTEMSQHHFGDRVQMSLQETHQTGRGAGVSYPPDPLVLEDFLEVVGLELLLG